jgi:hypothetical protein
MEEKKKIQMVTKPTYEDLLQQIEGLKGINQQLYNQLNSINMSNLFKRLDYLFKVLEHKDAFNSKFIDDCAKEICAVMTPPEEDETEATESKE